MSAVRSVLVTGSSGFLGRHLVRRLVDSAYAVTLLQRSDWRIEGVHEVLRVDELTPIHLRERLRGRIFDWVVHLAGAGTTPSDRDIETLFRLNVDVTRTLTQIAAGWPAAAVFVAGSGSEYAFARMKVPAIEDSPLEARSLYAASKAAGTLSAVAIATALKLPLAVGRLFGVYGPGEAPHRLFPSLLARLQAREAVALSAGDQQRDFIYVDDAIDAILAILLALARNPNPIIVNIATGNPVPVRSFAETVADGLGASRSLLRFGDLPKRPDDVPVFSGDPSLMASYTGWMPRYDVKSGIARSIEVLKQTRQI